jgi:hypothetical protein
MTSGKERIKQYDRQAFQYQPAFELGLASNSVNIKNRYGRFIGSVEAKEVPMFKSMSKGELPSTFVPASNWRLVFSVVLMDELGLVL